MNVKFIDWADKKHGIKRFSLRWRDNTTKKQYMRHIKAKSEREAWELAEDIVDRIARGALGLCNWLDLIDKYVEAKHSLSTIDRVEEDVKRFVEFAGNICVESMPRTVFYDFLMKIKNETSPSNADKYRRELLSVARWGRKQGLLKNISFEYMPSLVSSKQKKKRGYIPFNKIPDYLEACDIPFRFIIEFLTFTGVRSGAACSINETDLTETTVVLREKGNVERTLLRDSIIDNIINRSLEYKKSIGSNSAALFVRERGDRWNPSAVSQRFKTSLERAGLPIHVPHELRHTMGTGAGVLGKSPDQIKALLGHASRQTSEIYTHVDEIAARDIRGEVFEKLMQPSLSQNLSQEWDKSSDVAVSNSDMKDIEVLLPDGSKRLIGKELLDKILNS